MRALICLNLLVMPKDRSTHKCTGAEAPLHMKPAWAAILCAWLWKLIEAKYKHVRN